MGIKTGVNYPLLNELVEMGVLSSKSSPTTVGPFRIKTEAFAGDSSGETKELEETPLSGGIFTAVTIATAAGTDNTLTALTEDTDFSLSENEITYLGDYSNHQILIQYAY